MIFLLALLLGALGLANMASAHGIMIEPYPYNYVTEPLYQNWPLSADLPFPCQGRTQHIEKDRAILTAGTNQTVKFWVSAVHGGGSCQFSIAYGYPPPANVSEWKTLYTIIGGCPAEAAGNLPTVETDANGRANGPQCGNDTGAECVRQFSIPLPAGLANGDATFAWTWLNKIGNREYYMSCSPVTITGGTDDRDFIDTLPPVFQANIPGQCTTGASGSVVNIPNPGRYGIVYDEPSPGANNECPTAPSPSFQSGSSDIGTGAASSTISSSSSSSSISTSDAPITFATVMTGSKLSATMTTAAGGTHPTLLTTSSVPLVPSAVSSAPSSSTAASGAGGEVPCTAGSGMVECFSDSTFGICNEGWAVPQSLNPNQVCSDGEITYKATSGS